jgi:hypothetical protein
MHGMNNVKIIRESRDKCKQWTQLLTKAFYLPTDAQENYFKKSIKIYFKTAPTCFGLITIIRERISRAC